MRCVSKVENLTRYVERIGSRITCQVVAKSIRIAFVLFGIAYLLYSFTKTMQRVKEHHILVKDEVLSPLKYKYPSVTFCYKYKHGNKDVLNNYYPELYSKWKQSGNGSFILDVFLVFF